LLQADSERREAAVGLARVNQLQQLLVAPVNQDIDSFDIAVHIAASFQICPRPNNQGSLIFIIYSENRICQEALIVYYALILRFMLLLNGRLLAKVLSRLSLSTVIPGLSRNPKIHCGFRDSSSRNDGEDELTPLKHILEL
jgi:hypothetical protein